MSVNLLHGCWYFCDRGANEHSGPEEFDKIYSGLKTELADEPVSLQEIKAVYEIVKAKGGDILRGNCSDNYRPAQARGESPERRGGAMRPRRRRKSKRKRKRTKRRKSKRRNSKKRVSTRRRFT